MRGIILFILLLVLVTACKKKIFEGPDFYEDTFENYYVLDELLPANDVLWSYTQITKNANSIEVDWTKSHNGSNSLKFTAARSDKEQLSKCSIAKQKMAFWEGETVRLSAWYYIEGTAALEWLFLMDIEEQATISAGPGMRLALVDDQLRIEHKYNEEDIVQSAGQGVDFPRDQWVELVWEIHLSQKKKGTVKLWQNGQLIIDAKDRRTLPKDFLYAQQGTKGMYSSCEIGITANSYDNDLILWVDDVRFERVE